MYVSIFFELLYPAKLHPELSKISLEYYHWCILELSKECKIFLHQNYISHVWHHVRRPFTISSQKLNLIYTYVLMYYIHQKQTSLFKIHSTSLNMNNYVCN